MGFNPFKKKALTGTPAVIDAIQNGRFQPYPLLGGGGRDRIVEAYNTTKSANFSWIYKHSPAVRKVVDTIVRNVGQLELRLYEEINEAERQPRPDHPAALSLRYPSETVPQDKLIRSLFKDFLLFDDAFALLTPAPGEQLSLFRLPAHMVEVVGSSLFQAEKYRLWRSDGTSVDFVPNQILHWHGEDPDDPRIGVSKLETLRDVIAEDVALRQASVELANAGLTEPTWVFRPGDAPEWSNQAREGFEEDLNNRMRRRNKTPVVMEEGMELRSFGVSPRDAQMMEIRRWVTAEVATVYGVPLGMVGLADGDMDEARAEFYADTLPPYCEDFTKMLNHRVLVRAYGWTSGCFEFNLDEKHMGDDRLKALVSATGRPVMLTNEGRAKLNLPPVEGGDELVTPSNVIVGEKPTVDVMPIQDPNGPEQDGSHRENASLVLLDEAHFHGKREEPIQHLHPSRKAEHSRQLRNIDAFRLVTGKHFDRLERSLRNKSGKAAWNRWDKEFADDIHTLLEQVVEAEGTAYVLKLGGQEFDSRNVRHYLRVMATGSAEGINRKVRQEIDELGLADAVARFAAHTESAAAGLGAGATRFAREEAAKQAPDFERRVKVWVPNTNRHSQFGGDVVPLGEDWPAGFAPGTAPGCRCSMTIE